jgi:membrane protein implicated in regulation of membrane protease activity
MEWLVVGMIVVGCIALLAIDFRLAAEKVRKSRLWNGPEAMVGRRATVVKDFTRSDGCSIGTVKVSGELWKARTSKGDPIPVAGLEVAIKAVDGLILDVVVATERANKPVQADHATRGG